MRKDGVSRTLPALLIASLMVNMLLVGMLAGQFLAGSGPHHASGGSPPPPAEARMASSLLATLDTEDRARVTRVFREAMRGNRGAMAERHKARRGIAEALRAEPFDSAEMKAAFARLREADAVLQKSIQDTLADEMAQLSPEQRAALAELLQRRFAGQPRRGGRWIGRHRSGPE